VACRQQVFGSRPWRIGVSEGLTRALKLVGRSGLAAPGCRIAQPKPGSGGQGTGGLIFAGALVGRGLPLDARRAAALRRPDCVCATGGARASSPGLPRVSGGRARSAASWPWALASYRCS
jgi:hypothetical protein